MHRVGVLAPGDAAVVIACAAPHRTPAFRACEACIERLKHDVPIWKREVFEDGSVWVGARPVSQAQSDVRWYPRAPHRGCL